MEWAWVRRPKWLRLWSQVRVLPAPSAAGLLLPSLLGSVSSFLAVSMLAWGLL